MEKKPHTRRKRAASFQLAFFFSLNRVFSLYGSGFRTLGKLQWGGGSTALFGDPALRAAILKRVSFSCFTGERRKRRRKWLTGSRHVRLPGGAAQALCFGAGNPAHPQPGAASGPECAAGNESGAIGRHVPAHSHNKYTLRSGVHATMCYVTKLILYLGREQRDHFRHCLKHMQT